ncbi:MAG: glycosidase [Anaerolineae bacterium]|nr:glycosidase [Anaerolineae bacterium]
MSALKLHRHPRNPVLLPDPASDWESYNVFNPAVIYDNGLFHMWYRAQGLDWVSRIGYAVSVDGVVWNRFRRPVLEPRDGADSRGVEDPRVVRIAGTYYMTYTAYGREYAGDTPTHDGGGISPMVARSQNGIAWERVGSLVCGEDNKDHVLFPRKVGERFAALHRRRPDVWLAYSDDLVAWCEDDMAPVFGPRPGNGWDETSVGGNGAPIETEHGWLMLYHAYDEDHVYRLGACLLDLEDPTKVLRRPQAPIFWPEELWELRGDVGHVVFSCANPVVEGVVYVYYGGGDHVIGLATCTLDDLIDFVLGAE